MQEKLNKAATPSDTPTEPPAKNVPSATRRYTKEITTYGKILFSLVFC